jgi:glutamate dehydrogenase
MIDATGATPDRIAAAFTVVRNSFRLVALNSQIDALDNKIDGEAQLGLYAELQNLLLDRMVWFLRNVDLEQGLAAIIKRYHANIEEIAQALDGILPDELAVTKAARVDGLKKAGVPTELAQRIGDLRALGASTDIVLIALPTGRSVVDVAATYFAASAFFRLQDVAAAAREIRLADYYDRLAFDRALAQIGEALRALTARMVDAGTPGRDAVGHWAQRRGQDVERTRLALHEVVASGLTLSKLSVAANMLGDLAR